MSINVLNPEVAARIAAGEVVERPASAVKELIENALDAGGTIITVQVTGGGLGSILVSDNGSGIAFNDTSALFKRHATSKIQSENDLLEITTYGFRGEALHSLSAVAETSILTRQSGAISGTLLVAYNGKVQEMIKQASRVGTTVKVENLFGSIPVRKKFLRSVQSETSRVKNVVYQYALACPSVQFRLIVDGRPAITTSGHGNIREVGALIYGTTLGQAFLMPRQLPDKNFSLTGLIGPPSYHRSNRGYISIFVNRRPIQTRNLVVAITEAYKGFLPHGRFPIVNIFLEIPSEEIDINVHPTKSEVRFHNEDLPFTLIRKQVRETLLEHSPASEFQFIPYLTSTTEKNQNNANTLTTSLLKPILGQPLIACRPKSITIPPETPIPLKNLFPALRVIGQLRKTYIVAEGPDALYLIDQHAAHECVLYEKIQSDASATNPTTQSILEPILIALSATQESFVNEKGNLLSKHGWEIEQFGSNNILVRGVPPTTSKSNITQTFLDILDSAIAENLKLTWNERISASMACHSSVTAGMVLPYEQMVEVVRLLEIANQPHTCPHGRPTTIRIGMDQLEKEFLRK